MAYDNDQNEFPLPVNGNNGGRKSTSLLPKFFRTQANEKFLETTLDQLVQPGVAEKLNGYIGRKISKSFNTNDVYIGDVSQQREDYQFEPSVVVKDELGNYVFNKDYNDYLNQIRNFGGNTDNQDTLNAQEYYAWNPNIDLDKFVNFREYYWLPNGPQIVSIAGQARGVQSTYAIDLQNNVDNQAYIFSPDGKTQNPSITLYRGQTYTFEINSQGFPFNIRTAKTLDSAFNYKDGVSAQNVEVGTITFEVSTTAPEVLYYVSGNDINTSGLIKIADIEENTDIDVEKEIIGKKSYTTENNLSLSNGMKIEFIGNVTPKKYATGKWYVEGVGDKIKLINEQELEVTSAYVEDLTVPFDVNEFDRLPYDNASGYTANKDYIVINRSSPDRNPWSRHNRWFHRDVIEKSADYNKQEINVDQSARATRPIIEFNAGIKLFNFGAKSKANIDLVDTFTTDIFSTIEGSLGYTVDGIKLVDGMRVLFTAEQDIRETGKIFEIQYIIHNGRRQLHLKEVEDSVPNENETVLVLNGVRYQGQMWFYNGTEWKQGQDKTKTNEQPLFDLYDEQGNSYADTQAYPNSTFVGNKIFSYKIGVGSADKELGFPLAYRSIENVGDIEFEFNLLNENFTYTITPASPEILTLSTDTCSLHKFIDRTEFTVNNAWEKASVNSRQNILRQYVSLQDQRFFYIDQYENSSALQDLSVKIYVNNTLKFLDVDYVINREQKNARVEFINGLNANDIILIRSYSSAVKTENGIYEIPDNLEKNPLNNNIVSFTLGEVNDHVGTIVANSQGFKGVFPGNSNLRDLGNINPLGTKFLQHSGPINLALYHIVDKETNIIKSLDYVRREYAKFKRLFLQTSLSTGFDGSAKEHVDIILKKINDGKNINMPFYFSDMAPAGGEKRLTFTVIDEGNTFYPLSAPFDNTQLGVKATTVYINDNQLIYGRDYSFNEEGFCVITATKNLNDRIDIYEYETTDGSFIPPTPTKLGLYPKFIPTLIEDDTYSATTKVIQGHDGSFIKAFDDYRDDLLLELEKRIYNNIKISYDINIIDILDFIPGEYRNTGVKVDNINNAMISSFADWLASVGDVDYTVNSGYLRSNSFTFNYSNMTSPQGTVLPGYWRAVYKQAYDTDRPHTNPWEMLGFTIKPTWWEEQYGPAPYTSSNLLLWEDIENGIIREPNSSIIIKQQYKRPGLSKHLPVNEQGELLSPLDSRYAKNFVSGLTSAPFVFGDHAVVETAWRRSSEYPFALMKAWILNQPAKIMGIGFDRSRIVRNNSGQLVYKPTNKRLRLTDLQFPNSSDSNETRVFTAGLVNFISNYLASNILSNYNVYRNRLKNVNNQLAFRLAGFTDKSKFNLILDSRTPLNEGNVFVPNENFSVILSDSSPLEFVAYSGVVIERVASGYIIRGYDINNPVFKYKPYITLDNDPFVNVGGISEVFVNWSTGQRYEEGLIVENNNNYFRCNQTHTSSDNFEADKFTKLSELPTVGGRGAIFRKSFSNKIATLPYGTLLRTSQEVVDFILGYEKYLKDLGFVFDNFSGELQQVQNFRLAAKEFLFWTAQGWENGSLISLSPGAERLEFVRENTVVDNVFDNFFDYSIIKADGTKLKEEFINLSRTGGKFTITPKNTADGIYAIKLPIIQKEHIVVLDNITEFRDVIYDLEPGYRQERIRVLGYRTADWDGSLSIPGFLYDEAKVTLWESWKDYNVGDIVQYKEFYYTALNKVAGSDNFNASQWFRLQEKPQSTLYTNIEYKTNQFADFYDLDTDNFDVSQQEIAQHLIGYQKRKYLSNIINDDVSQYKFYQGFIADKGTQNALTRLFDALGAADKESLEFYEEWAVKTGQLGAADGFAEIEYKLDETKYRLSPQPILLTDDAGDPSDLVYRIPSNEVYVKSNDYNHRPFPTQFIPTNETAIRTAGYVREEDVDHVIKHKNEILELTTAQVSQGDYFWVTFENQSWNVYKHIDSGFTATEISTSNGVATITLDKRTSFVPGDYLGIYGVDKFSGFFEVVSTQQNIVNVNTTIVLDDPLVDIKGVVTKFISVRVPSLLEANTYAQKNLENQDKLWVDNIGNQRWNVIKSNESYEIQNTVLNPIETDSAIHKFGESIAADDSNTKLVVGAPNVELGKVYVYTKNENGSLNLRQTLEPTDGIAQGETNFGQYVTMSPDGNYLVVSAPNSSNVKSFYRDSWNPSSNYNTNEIVQYNDALWQARRIIKGEDPNVDFNSFNSYALQKERELARFDEFDTSTSGYSIGDFVKYKGKLYQATNRTLTGSAFNANNWSLVEELKTILTGDYPLADTITDHLLVRAPVTEYEGSKPGDEINFDWNEITHQTFPMSEIEIVDVQFEGVDPSLPNTTGVFRGIRLQTQSLHGLVDGDEIIVTNVPNDTNSSVGFNNSNPTLPFNEIQNKGVTGLEYKKYFAKVISGDEIYLYTTQKLDVLVDGANNTQGADFFGSADSGNFNGYIRKINRIFDGRLGGAGAKFTFTIDSNTGSFTEFNISLDDDNNPIGGAGYTAPVVKIFTTSNAPVTQVAVITPTVVNGEITSFTITNPGAGYIPGLVQVEIEDTEIQINNNWFSTTPHTIVRKIDEIFYVIDPLNVPSIGDIITTPTGNATVVYTKFELGKLVIYANNKNGVFAPSGDLLEIDSTFKIGPYTRPAADPFDRAADWGGYWQIDLSTINTNYAINPNDRISDTAYGLVYRDLKLQGDLNTKLPYETSTDILNNIKPIALDSGKILDRQAHIIRNLSYFGNANTNQGQRQDILSDKWLLRAPKNVSDYVVTEVNQGGNPQIGVWLNTRVDNDGNLPDLSFSGLTREIINGYPLLVDIWDGYIDVKLDNTTTEFLVGDKIQEGSDGIGEVVYYQRDGVDARYYIKTLSGTFTKGADFGPPGASALATYKIRRIDQATNSTSGILGTTSRIVLNDSQIGKIFVFQHGQDLPKPTNTRATGLASFNNDFIDGYEYEYHVWVNKVREGINRVSNIPAVENNDWFKVTSITASTNGIASSYENEGLIYIYQFNNTSEQYDLINPYLIPNRTTESITGTWLKIIKHNDLYKLFVNSADNNGRIYTILNGTALTGETYNWELSKDPSYRGVYSTDLFYYENDIVYYSGTFYKALTNMQGGAFNINNWTVQRDHIDFVGFVPNPNSINFQGDSSLETPDVFGKIFDVSDDGKTIATIAKFGTQTKCVIYKIVDKHYELFQTIEALPDQLGYGTSIAVSDDGKLIAVSAPLATGRSTLQGQVIIYRQPESGQDYIVHQILSGETNQPIENFGYNIAFDGNQLIVASANGDIGLDTTFDSFADIDPQSVEKYNSKYVNDSRSERLSQNTIFDSGFTNFNTTIFDSGVVYVFERILDTLVYGQQIEYRDFDVRGFGKNILIKNDHLYVGLTDDIDNNIQGKVLQYNKDGVNTWTVIRESIDQVNLNKFRGSFLYNTKTNEYLTGLDLIDPIAGKISGYAEQELSYKTYFDPATYTKGTDQVVVDGLNPWGAAQVGKLWWDLSTTKFINPYQGTITYSTNSWNRLAHGASIDVYEWVESNVLPSKWNEMADTNAGTKKGISGTTKYGDTVFVQQDKYDSISQTFTPKYYFWVKNKKIIPDVENRNRTAIDVARIIEDPAGQQLKFVNLLSDNRFVVRNSDKLLSDNDVAVNFRYWTIDDQTINIHNEYQILSEGLDVSNPKKDIERKWFDSLIGYDSYNRVVPDPTLSVKQKYGSLNRPRQSWFVNRKEALKQFIERVNNVLVKKLITDSYDITPLLAKDPLPTVLSRTWDIVIDTEAEIQFIGTAKATTATLQPVLQDGIVKEVNIISPGFGYIDPIHTSGERKGPKVTINGTGEGLELQTIIDSLGKIIRVDVLNGGKNYADDLQLTVRPLSALVRNDSTLEGDWAIYGYNSETNTWTITTQQSFDVSDYWDYIDWYDTGFSQLTSIDYLVQETYELNIIDDQIGDVIKVENVGTGGWELLQKTLNQDIPDYTINYKTIGRQNGSIRFKDSLYTESKNNSLELRKILEGIRDNLFVDELKFEYNNLFFASLRYVFSEQNYVDWAFKTSFIKAKHNVGQLIQKTTYQNDNLPSFEEYVREVKPYKTNIREYLSTYDAQDNTSSVLTDFDLSPRYNNDTGVIQNAQIKVVNDTIIGNFVGLDEYPARHWVDNSSYEVKSIEIKNPGTGFTEVPVVSLVGGGGTGAKAKAFVGNGQIKSIQVTNPGTGYYSAPLVVIDGNQEQGSIAASASAILGNDKVRTTSIKQKFDRTGLEKTISELQTVLGDLEEQETFIAEGSILKFKLKWPLALDIAKVNITLNGIEALRSQFNYYNEKDVEKGYTRYRGVIEFNFAPGRDTVIVIDYSRSLELLNAHQRIQFLYEAQAGQYGKDLAQLMDGIDYGGVEVKSFEFGGALGWFTGNDGWYASTWDSYDEEYQDEVFITDGSTTTFQLENAFEEETEYNIYANGIRLDDPNYDGSTGTYWNADSTQLLTLRNPNAIMQTLTIDSPEYDAATKTVSIENIEAFEKIVVDKAFNPPKDVQIVIRKSTSDGSFLPITLELESTIQGGNLAYGTATGLNAGDINIDGDGFVTPTTSKGPEELIPGQIIDTLDIKVYDRITDGGSLIAVRNYTVSNVDETTFDLKILPHNIEAVIVKVDNVIVDKDSYEINFRNKTITFESPLTIGQKVSTISMSGNGENILDIDNFIGDGSTQVFVTNVLYEENISLHVVIDGVNSQAEIFETDSTYDGRAGLVGIKFVVPPEAGAFIYYALYSSKERSYSEVAVDRFVGDGSTVKFQLSVPPFSALPLSHKVIVKVDNKILYPGYTQQFIVESKRTYQLDKHQIAGGSISPDNVVIYVNGIQQQYLQGFNWDFNNSEIILFDNVGTPGDILDVYILNDGEYEFDSNTQMVLENVTGTFIADEEVTFGSSDSTVILATVKSFVNNTLVIVGSDQALIDLVNADNTVSIIGTLSQATASRITNLRLIEAGDAIILNNTPATDAKIDIYQFSKHDIQGVERITQDILTRSTLTFESPDYYEYNKLTQGLIKLKNTALDPAYLWISINGELLTANVDYTLTENLEYVKITNRLSKGDRVDIVQFTGDKINDRFGFRIFKDMLNRTIYKRLNGNKTFILDKDLLFYDKEIHLVDITGLTQPNKETNTPGILFIDGERIEYFEVSGNVLSQLRRGTLGTGVKDKYNAGSEVTDQSAAETIPYSDQLITEIKTSNLVDGVNKVFDLEWSPVVYATSLQNDVSITESNSITLVAGNNTNNLPATGTIKIGDEYISYIKKDGVVLTGIGRGAFGSPVSSHTATAQVNLVSSNEFELFVAGRRLRKVPIELFDTKKDQDSPEADIIINAEYYVENNQVILNHAPVAGTKVFVVRKLGKLWQKAGETLRNAKNPIAEFLREQGTDLPK